jgi:hypothetical protein
MSEHVLSDEESRELLMKIKGAAIASAFGITSLPEKELFERLEGLYLQGMEHGQALGIKRGKVEREKPEWVRISDALPVVPEGENYVGIWIYFGGKVCPIDFYPESNFSQSTTHWRYAEPTPLPPETTK